MSNPIRTYDDLLKERRQLENQLQTQKELIKQDFIDVKQQLQPVANAASIVGKMFTRDQSNLLLTGGINQLVNLLFKNVILSRSGWLTRLIVPFIIKNYSSHFIAEHKSGLLKKILTMFNRKHSNGQAKHAEYPESENI